MAGLLSVRFPPLSLFLAWPAQTALRTGHRAPGSRHRQSAKPRWSRPLPDSASRGRHLLGAAAHFSLQEDGCGLGTQDAASRRAVKRPPPAAGPSAQMRPERSRRGEAEPMRLCGFGLAALGRCLEQALVLGASKDS